MQLEQYLEKLKTCPDDRLKIDCGVYDNFIVYLKAEVEQIKADLLQSEKYADRSRKGCQAVLNIAEKVEFSLNEKRPRGTDYVALLFPKGTDDLPAEARDYWEKNQEYTMSVSFHQVGAANAKMNLRQIAQAIIDFADYLREKKIPACFPNPVGYHWNGEDFSKIVYHQPE